LEENKSSNKQAEIIQKKKVNLADEINDTGGIKGVYLD